MLEAAGRSGLVLLHYRHRTCLHSVGRHKYVTHKPPCGLIPLTASAHWDRHALTHLPNRGRVWMVRPWQAALVWLRIICRGIAHILHGSDL